MREVKKHIWTMISLIAIAYFMVGCGQSEKQYAEYECTAVYICGKAQDGWRIRRAGDSGIELREKNQAFARILFTEDEKKEDQEKGSYFYRSKKDIGMLITMLDDTYRSDVEAYADGFYKKDHYITKITAKNLEKGEDPDYEDGGSFVTVAFEPEEENLIRDVVGIHYDGKVYTGNIHDTYENKKLTRLETNIAFDDFETAKQAAEEGILAVDGSYIYYEITENAQ